ncbi:hypothetical protein PENTCL1PPCAC_23371, partial [Pristionchus entomophagus]
FLPDAGLIAELSIEGRTLQGLKQCPTVLYLIDGFFPIPDDFDDVAIVASVVSESKLGLCRPHLQLLNGFADGN